MSDETSTENDSFDDIGGADDWESLPTVAEHEAEVKAAAETTDTAPAETEQSVEEQSEQQVATKSATTPAAKKSIAFKVGEQELQVDENAVFNWRIDGKEQPIALKELVQHYAGKIPWERKYQELSTERKKAASEVAQFEQTRERHAKLINDMHKNAAEGKVFEAVQSMIEMTGLDKKVDAREYVRNLRTSLMEQAKKLAAMDEHQRALFEAHEERDYLKSRTERLLQQQEQERAQVAFQERVAKAVQDAGTTLEEYVQTRDWLTQRLKGMGRDVAQVTPEFVTSHIRDVRDYQSVKEALTSIDPELVKNEKLWDHGVYLLRSNPDWTQEDLRDVLRKAAELKRSTAVSRTAAKAPVATVATASTKVRPKQQRAMAFDSFSADDLDW